MKKNKIILFVLTLVLLAGIIIVCTKGFNVSLDLRAHNTLKFVFDKEFKKSDVTKICDEVFKDKKYEIKTVEVFSDAVYIISPEITDKQEIQLLEKLDALYKDEEKENVVKTDETQTEETSDTNNEVADNTTENSESSDNQEETETSILDKLDEGSKYNLYYDSKIRISDIVKPYIMPSVISAIIIVIYMGIKYRKLNDGNPLITICKTLGEMLLILSEIMAVIAIVRIPFSRTLVPILMFIIVTCLCFRFVNFEKKLKDIEEQVRKN